MTSVVKGDWAYPEALPKIITRASLPTEWCGGGSSARAAMSSAAMRFQARGEKVGASVAAVP
jgi:hypothetical protein